MAVIETSVKIHKPVDQVWAFITNLENQKKLSSYISGIEVGGPLTFGTQYRIEPSSMGMNHVTSNEVVSFEPNKKLGVKTFAAPPASDVTNTYLLEPDGDGTKLTLQMDATLVPAGMPSMPGMEEMMKTQMKAWARWHNGSHQESDRRVVFRIRGNFSHWLQCEKFYN